jgi:uncharacterized protein (TIRG00374 family)
VTLTRVLGFLLTIVFLVLAFSRVDLAAFAEEMRRVNYVWILPSAICTLLGYVVRTLRWRVILSGAARAPVSTLFPILIMGFATNNLLPGRLGEFWRAYLLGRKRDVRKSFALASVFVERVFDGLTLVFLLALVSISIQLPDRGREVELVAAVIFLGATLGVAILLWRPALVQVPLHRLSTPLPRRWRVWADERLETFIDGLAPLRRPSVLLTAAVLSVGVWLLEGSSYLLLSRGVDLGLSPATEVPAIGLTLVSINLGIMVPSGPGYVGTQEFFGTWALGVVGANPHAALAMIVVSHAVQYVLVTSLGLVFFAREHLWPQQLQPALMKEPEPAA